MGFRVEWHGDDILKRVDAAAAEELVRIAEDVKAESERLCPKARGYNGGLVSTALLEVDKENLSTAVRYTAPHAWLQHERRDYHHKSGEQAKYLQQPLLAMGQRFCGRLGSAIRARIGR